MLTLKQEKFVDTYIKTGNATEAAVQAGYDVKDRTVAQSIGSENLTKPLVRDIIQARKNEIAEKLEAEAMSFINDLMAIARNLNTPASVRVKALTELLDRAGYSVKREFAIGGTGEPLTLETKHTQDIAKRARTLLAERLGQEESQA